MRGGFESATMITKAIRRSLTGLAALGFAFLLSACYETRQEFTLNPDGSGKLLHECSFQNVNLGNKEESPEDALQAAVARIINDSKGVDAWDDVSFKLLDDGRMWFRGTAYFKKLEALEIQNQSMFTFKWNDIGTGKAELVLNLKKSAEPKEKKEPAEMTPEERTKKIKAERAKFQQAKPMFSAMLGGLKQTVAFRLPGKVESSSNFKSDSPGVLGLSFEGAKMIEALEKLISDDDWLAKQGFDAQSAPELDAELAGMLFGEKAAISAKISTTAKPLFDYAAGLATAKKGADALQKKLGVLAIASPAEGGELKSIKVVGVRMAREVDKKLDLRPFHQDAGYTFSVLAEFSGSVLDVTDKSVITSATASDGSSLVKGNRDWDRRLGFPKLSADNASVMFDLELKLPAPGVQGIKEVSGVLQYRVAEGTKEIDLGPMELKAGAKATELGAEIKDIKDGWKKDGSKEIELSLKLKPQDLKSVSLVVDGVKTELKRSGYSGMNTTTTFSLQSESALPEKATLIVEIHDKLQTFEAPFRLENLSLLGEALVPGA
jgi:hypothetical protein